MTVLLCALMIISYMPLLPSQTAYADSTGTAYAVLDKEGTLYFIHSTDDPTGTAPNQKIKDVKGNEYTGTVYTGFETAEYKNAASVPWHKDADKIRSISRGDSYSNYCTPKSTAHWFEDCINLTTIPEKILYTQNVLDMSYMFAGCTKLESFPEDAPFTTSNVKYMNSMFEGCTSLESIEFSAPNLLESHSMFQNCKSLTHAWIDCSDYTDDESSPKLEDASSMFAGCSNLEQTFGESQLINATDISFIYQDCKSLKEGSIYLGSSLTNASYAFDGCTSLTDLDLYTAPGTTRLPVSNMSGMFRNCSSLRKFTPEYIYYELEGETEKINTPIASPENTSEMFKGCSNIGSDNINLSFMNITDSCNTKSMFSDAASANRDGSAWVGAASSQDAANILNDASKTCIDTDKLRFSIQHTINFHNCYVHPYNEDDNFDTSTEKKVLTRKIFDGRTLKEARYDDIQGERQYFDFAGWYTDEALTKPFSINTPVTEDMDLYAKWVKAGTVTDPDEDKEDQNKSEDDKNSSQNKQYTVTFDSNGGSAVASQTVKSGSRVQRPADPARYGYTFAGWYTDSALKQAYDFDKAVSSGMTLYAKWTAKSDVAPVTPTEGTGKGLLKLRVSAKKGSRTQSLKWSKVKGAEGYDVYFGKCGSDFRRIGSTDALKFTKKNLRRGRSYKYYVNAYKYSDGKKVYISTSLICHSYAGGHSRTRTNAKKVVVSPKDITLEKGGSMTLAPTTIKYCKGYKLPGSSHGPAYRYQSSNSKIAKVRKGVITAKRSGTCRVYVYAQNGIRAAVKVTVK